SVSCPAKPAENWPNVPMRVVLVVTARDAGNPPIKAQFAQVWSVEVTLGENSRSTLADPNGVQVMSPLVKVRPTRRVTRPIRLSISGIAKVPLTGTGTGPPNASESTCIRDQITPADGSTNQPS